MFRVNGETVVYLEQGLTLEEADAMGVLGGHDYYMNYVFTSDGKNNSWEFSVKDIQDENDIVIEPTNDITEIIEFATQLLYDLIHGEPISDGEEEWLADAQYRLDILEDAKERIIKRREKKNVTTR